MSSVYVVTVFLILCHVLCYTSQYFGEIVLTEAPETLPLVERSTLATTETHSSHEGLWSPSLHTCRHLQETVLRAPGTLAQLLTEQSDCLLGLLLAFRAEAAY